MTGVLGLAARLRAMNDVELRQLLDSREISPTKIDDFFDLAEALLERRSIQSALSTLERRTLAVLAAPASQQDAAEAIPGIRDARALLLVQADAARAVPYDAVTEQLASWPSIGLPSADELAHAAAAPVPSPPTRDAAAADRLAAEHAFGSISAVAELIAELGRTPAHELQKGGIALPDRKRLASATSTDLDQVDAYVSIAARTGLIVKQSGYWLATDAAKEWGMQPTPDRWAALASAWLAAVPDGIRQVLVTGVNTGWGEAVQGALAWRYPAGGNNLTAQVHDLGRDAEALGISTDQLPSTAGGLLFGAGVDAAAAVLAEHFPHEVDRVYLQPDLTIVSPGTLSPALDARLREMANVEVRAQASSYRLSAASLNRAIAAGETASGILEFLAAISLTGVPQPLEYLIVETAARFGMLRVAATEDAGSAARSAPRSLVHSSDTGLVRTLEVDQSLASLFLRTIDEHHLVSRFERDVVYWALTDAGYPAAAEDTMGAIVALTRHAAAAPTASSDPDTTGALIARLRQGQSTGSEETSAAWLARQLEIAVRGRVPLVVTVAVRQDELVEFLLEPTGIGGGRLRGRDRNSDIERTLPLSHIRNVVPAVD